MACDRLTGRPEPLWRVRVPQIEGRPFVAMHAPEHIARLYASRQPLSAADRLALAQDFARIRTTCGPVRRLERGRVVGIPSDYYAPLLLAACHSDWQAAAHVVGTAMGNCDGPNLMSDGFFSARLGSLIDAGRIEASGPRTRLGAYAVRLSGMNRRGTGIGGPVSGWGRVRRHRPVWLVRIITSILMCGTTGRSPVSPAGGGPVPARR